MKHIPVFITILLFLGCTHTKMIAPDAPESVFESMNIRLPGKSTGLTLAGGFGAGALIGYFASGDPPEDCLSCYPREAGAVLVGLIVGGFGGAAGLLGGSARGRRYVYRFGKVK
jgi:hypothetical protein